MANDISNDVMNSPQLKGLFLNTAKANCSIHESGRMCFDCLKLSTNYTLDYQEIDETSRNISLDYDFYVFNYHQITMGWLDTATVKELPGFKCTIVLEVLPNNPFVMCPKGDFDAYLVLDPTLGILDSNVHPFPRPLEQMGSTYTYQEKEIPVIGTFGFATKGKGFDKVIDAVSLEFDKAVVRINIPNGDYVADSELEMLSKQLRNHKAKQGIEVRVTHDFFNKEELIRWCSENTLNVFLYNRNIQGLSATTDQAITSGRPLAISSDPTFRHIHTYLKPYPFQTLKESIVHSAAIVEQIKQDWSPLNFAHKFEDVLAFHKVRGNKSRKAASYLLPKQEKRSSSKLKGIRTSDFIPPILYKIKRRLFKQKSTGQESSYKTLDHFVHYALGSYSQHNEDLLLDLLLGRKDNGVYVDIGANHPTFNSNTKRFYNRGWTGINIEPNVDAFETIKKARTRDVNLNLAVAEKEDELVFYKLADDSTLSTLDYSTAQKMSKMLSLPISSTNVKTLPLTRILEEHQVDHIDFMSVDAEGYDLTVLKSNDWRRFRPSIVMVESNNQFREILEYMDLQDYLHIFSNSYNAVFFDKRCRDSNLLRNLNWQQN